jgi:methyltransferase
MPEQLIWSAAIFAYLVGRIGEYRVHKVNYTDLVEAGAEELMPRMMSRYYMLTIVIIPLAIFEQFWTRAPIFWEMWAGGLGLLVVAQALRVWSIYALGTFWSMRCLTLSGALRVSTGPYRILKNPEYLSRIMDGVGDLLNFWC